MNDKVKLLADINNIDMNNMSKIDKDKLLTEMIVAIKAISDSITERESRPEREARRSSMAWRERAYFTPINSRYYGTLILNDFKPKPSHNWKEDGF